MNRPITLLRTLAFCSVVSSFPALAQNPLYAWNNKPMPQFVITTVDGKKLTNASLKGKVVFFDFWATWCGPCKMASPAVEKLGKMFAGKNVVVIGADVMEQTPGVAAASHYKHEHGYTYTFTYNNDGLAKTLGIDSIPAFLIMDKKGVIRGLLTGFPGEQQLVGAASKKIDHLLKS